MIHRTRRGLTLPIAGRPETKVDRARHVARVGIVADDHVGLRPRLHVAVGEAVQRGQLLFEDKAIPGVRYTSTAEGVVAAIHRGDRRAFQSVVITLSSAEQAGRGAQVSLSSFTGGHPTELSSDAVRALLLESGLWTSLRARPYSRVADPRQVPRSIFVTATDTDPLAPDPDEIIRERSADFTTGLAAMARLADGPLFLCTSERFGLTLPSVDRLRHERFAGPHPSGTVGFHIHRLDPAGRERLVWHIGYQDVLAVGHLFACGLIDDRRTIALAGPAVRRPRLVETRVGAAIDDVTAGELLEGRTRILSGSVLSGRVAAGATHGYLGRYHRQICALPEGGEREFLGWASPGLSTFSATGLFLSKWLRRRRFQVTTSTNGSLRAIVPIGVYEKVMPFDVEPTYLLKALVMRDVERAEQLGCLEFDEEDLALCTFVCPGKHEYGRYLREVLSMLETES